MRPMLRLRAGKKSAAKKYPPKYEKAIPLTLGIIAFFVAVLLVVIALVITGALPEM